MSTLSLNIDARGAQKGAKDFKRSTDQIKTSAMQAESAVDQMGKSVANTSKGMSGRTTFIFQNTANQLGDIAVQASMGTNMFRVLGMQLPQIAGGFALLGGSLGVVAPILGIIAAIGFPILATMTSFGRSAGQAAEELDKVAAAIDDLSGYDKLLEKELVEPLDEAAIAAQRLIDTLRRQKFETVRGGLITALSDELQPFQDRADELTRIVKRTRENINRLLQVPIEDRQTDAIAIKMGQVDELQAKIKANQAIVDQVVNAFRTAGTAGQLADNLLEARNSIADMFPESLKIVENFDKILEDSGLTELILARTRDTQITISKKAKEEAEARERSVKAARDNFMVEASVAVQEQRILELRKAWAEKQRELDQTKPLQKSISQIKQLSPEIERLRSAADMVGQSFEKAFMSAVNGTISMKDAFKNLARDIISELYRVFVVKQITGFISGFIADPAMFGGLGGGGQVTRPRIRPEGLQSGGPMQAGRPYIVGEAGPELVVPSHSGTVVPNHALQSRVTIMQNFNFAANGDDSVKKIIAQAAPQIAKMTQQSMMDARRRGGQMKAVFG